MVKSRCVVLLARDRSRIALDGSTTAYTERPPSVPVGVHGTVTDPVAKPAMFAIVCSGPMGTPPLAGLPSYRRTWTFATDCAPRFATDTVMAVDWPARGKFGVSLMSPDATARSGRLSTGTTLNAELSFSANSTIVLFGSTTTNSSLSALSGTAVQLYVAVALAPAAMVPGEAVPINVPPVSGLPL